MEQPQQRSNEVGSSSPKGWGSSQEVKSLPVAYLSILYYTILTYIFMHGNNMTVIIIIMKNLMPGMNFSVCVLFYPLKDISGSFSPVLILIQWLFVLIDAK